MVSRYLFDDISAKENIRYYYRLKQTDFNNDYKYSAVVTAIIGKNSTFEYQVLPNPYVNETNITYTLNENKIVLIEVLNSTGQVITTLAKGEQKAGPYSFVFGAKKAGYSAGVYTLRMIIADKIYTTKLIETE